MEYYFSLSQSLSCIYVGLVLFKSKVAVPTTSDREELSLSLHGPLIFSRTCRNFRVSQREETLEPSAQNKRKNPIAHTRAKPPERQNSWACKFDGKLKN
jgi:hypothetical protein